MTSFRREISLAFEEFVATVAVARMFTAKVLEPWRRWRNLFPTLSRSLPLPSSRKRDLLKIATTAVNNGNTCNRDEKQQQEQALVWTEHGPCAFSLKCQQWLTLLVAHGSVGNSHWLWGGKTCFCYRAADDCRGLGWGSPWCTRPWHYQSPGRCEAKPFRIHEWRPASGKTDSCFRYCISSFTGIRFVLHYR